MMSFDDYMRSMEFRVSYAVGLEDSEQSGSHYKLVASITKTKIVMLMISHLIPPHNKIYRVPANPGFLILLSIVVGQRDWYFKSKVLKELPIIRTKTLDEAKNIFLDCPYYAGNRLQKIFSRPTLNNDLEFYVDLLYNSIFETAKKREKGRDE